MPQPLFSPGKDPVPTEQEAGWAPGTVWTGAENLAPNEIRSPDRRAPSQSLYRLRYPAYHIIINENYLYHFFQLQLSIIRRLIQDIRIILHLNEVP